MENYHSVKRKGGFQVAGVSGGFQGDRGELGV
jgi:hypothetical protein